MKKLTLEEKIMVVIHQSLVVIYYPGEPEVLAKKIIKIVDKEYKLKKNNGLCEICGKLREKDGRSDQLCNECWNKM